MTRRTACRIAVAALVAAAFGATATAEDKAVPLFNGKSLDGWKLKGNNESKSKWRAAKAALSDANPAQLATTDATGKDGELVNTAAGGVDVYSDKTFGDCTIELEFMVPKGSNSGVYVMGEYEVQIFDSYGKEKLGQGDLGALYSAAAPKLNAAKKPGEWQTLVIDFQAPRIDAAGKKTANAKFVKVTLNGQVLHEGVEMKGPTPGGLTGKEMAAGPLMFQGDHGPVAYRNIKVTPKK